MPFYAHSLPSRPPNQWEEVETHLEEVANAASRFADALDCPSWGRAAGLWHDLGKYSPEFQRHIKNPDAPDADLETLSRVDHSTYGAQHAAKLLGDAGDILAFCIAGHHAGLTDARGDESSSLRQRLRKPLPSHDKIVAAAPDAIRRPEDITKERLVGELRAKIVDPHNAGFQLATFCRMLFSCLVDADFLATEAFMRPDRTASRSATLPSMAQLNDRVRHHIATFGDPTSAVNRVRASVLAECNSAATLPPGLFSLTVPTGGGKTLSSLAFALDHAETHDLRRVIYAIPYTSIIEQTAAVFRDALQSQANAGVVLEHHSSIDPEKESRWAQLASENWDAPVVVTTNVQLFESLFANRTSRCRKLHRIARSVIVLDEAQSLPVQLLHPCLAILGELVRAYGCTVVLCTATQPALNHRNEFPIGLDGVREIIRDVPSLFNAMRRTRIDMVGQKDDEWIARQLADNPQALCIVNTRSHAVKLWRMLSDAAGLFHLSSMMCAEHRTDVLARIRAALVADEPCRVVSTQVVEAGVDIDFPLVLRAMAGLDSIAQAAGRCNREGQLDLGIVKVFETNQIPPPEIACAANNARSVLPEHAADPLSPDAVEAFFRLHYWSRNQEWDKNGIMQCCDLSGSGRMLTMFREIALNFKMIDDVQRAIFVPYGDRGAQLVGELQRSDVPDRKLLRKLQRYTVNVPEHTVRQMKTTHAIIEPHDGLYVLANKDAYNEGVGLTTDKRSLGFLN
ncbi:MAG: CRISPR-associated endonuclease Cas3'' [Planctomycetes bacterium]|nr:CRISPR-associated endonuclease Cas3'' [Planctomycetota bacterium]